MHSSLGGGNRLTDPLFADEAARDLHLLPGSQAFSYALPLWTPARDHEGEAQPQGVGPDSGAYEDG